MSNKHGEFIWYELLAENADAALAFYSDLLGWQFSDSGQSEVDYRIFHATDTDTAEQHPIGGFIQLTAEMKTGGAQSAWLGYIAVDDVDACVERITGADGNVMMPAFDLPGVGRIALVTDPQGVLFYIMRGLDGAPASLAFADDKPRPGHCAWNELITTDPKAAMSFYQTEFGWEKEGEMDMGEMGAYEFIRHGSMIGAMMRKPTMMPVPVWNYYFRVDNVDVAVEKTKAAGGQILMGPEEIPGGEFIIQGIDPQGAHFALVGNRLTGS